MRKASVLFIAPSAYRLGGMQVWLHDLVSYLEVNSCWDVNIALVSGRHHCIKSYESVFPGFPVLPLENRTGSPEGRRQAIALLLRERSPDLVIGVNVADLYLAASLARLKGFKGRVVMSLHAIAADLLEDAKAYSFLIDAVIATNYLTCRILKDVSGFPEDRVMYAPYGVKSDNSLLNLTSSQSTNDPLLIAWVGRLEQDQKRIWDLLPILTHLDSLGLSYHLTIAGDGPEMHRLSDSLRHWTSRGLVTLLGALSPLQLQSDVYANHHVLLITSNWETGPIVAWEAMSAGLVVVSSSYIGSGLENALRHDENCLLFPIGDTVRAAHAIFGLRDSARRVMLSRRGQSLVKERYSKEASNISWFNALQKVLSLPSLPVASPALSSVPSGRLDRLLGIPLAEIVRQKLGIKYTHRSAGSEWPHTLHGTADEQYLLDIAAELDHHA
jgi:glycosyltransferase involved in cell wall biosynthesis